MKLFFKNNLPPHDAALAAAEENLAAWRVRFPLSDEEEKGITALRAQEEYFIQRFATLLPFGTAGLRGEMVPGCSAINPATVTLFTRALADVVSEAGGADRGVIVAFDSRLHSAEYAHLCAQVLAVTGIRVFLFDELRPTPELSFTLRRLGCQAGINITASHNPKKDNGYKVYWEDGAQLPPEQASDISARVMNMDFFTGIDTLACFDESAAARITVLDTSADEYYFDTLLSLRITPNLPESAKNLPILYTPLHGTGYRLVPEILRRAGFTHIETVPSQATPDGTFPTAEKPNPQNPEVFAPGIALARETGASLIIATDPDADRAGIAIRDHDGNYSAINGDEIGLLLLDYIIKGRILANTMPEKPFVVNSVVTSPLADRICAHYKIPLYHVYTGFKFIGEKIREKEDLGDEKCIFAYEESHGYLPGSYCRDKDGVATTLLIAEMAAFYAAQGMTCRDALNALHTTYGYMGNFQEAIVIKAADPMAKAAALMEKFFAAPPHIIADTNVLFLHDYLHSEYTDLKTGKVTPIAMTSDRVISFTLEDGVRITVRPSGTEPLIKFYYAIPAENKEAALSRYHAYKAAISALMA